jgi:predicted RNA-binding protein with PIN domain
MAFLLIDGYNLIGTAHDNLEDKRSHLIQALSAYSLRKGHDITLVFDGWKGGVPVETKTRTAHITIIYSKLGVTADSVIRRMIRDIRRDWIVVSSDKQISDFAVSKDLAAISSEEFDEILHRVLSTADHGDDRNISGEFKTDDGSKPRTHKRGNPRKKAKKQLKKSRALKKLS